MTDLIEQLKARQKTVNNFFNEKQKEVSLTRFVRIE